MPAPVTPVESGTARITATGSVQPATARAKITAFIEDGTGNAVLVSAANPLPTSGGGGGGGDATAANQVLQTAELVDINTNTAASLTDAQLRASPVPVSVSGGSDATAANQALEIAELESIDNRLADVIGTNGSYPPDYLMVAGTQGSGSRQIEVSPSGEVYVALGFNGAQAVLAVPPQATTATPSTFNSTIAAPLVAAEANRRSVLVYLPPDALGVLHILWGAGTVSASIRSYTLTPGQAYLFPDFVANLAATAILTNAADTAFVTRFV